jgi:hypothetical protein
MTTREPDLGRATGAARALLSRYGVTRPDHIDVEAICWGERLLVTHGPIAGADAWLLANSRVGTVRVREDIPYEGQRRFAIAHELGHWTLHRGVTQLHLDRPEQLRDYRKDPIEVEANAFAAEFLMPQALFESRLPPGPPDLARLVDVAREFAVGPTAATLRLVRMTEHPVMLVVHDGGKTFWYCRSTNCNLPPIKPGRPVPNAIAAGPLEDVFCRVAERREWYARSTKVSALREQSLRFPDSPTITLLSPVEA